MDWSAPLWPQREAVEAHVRDAVARCASGVKRRNYGKGHGYTVDGEKAPGVTTVLSVLDKSKPLVIWASRLEREASKRVAFDAYRDALPTGLTEEQFGAIFESYAEKSLAHVKALEEAANIGTGLHALVEHRVERMLGNDPGPDPAVPDAAWFIFPKWEEWARSVDFRPIVSEFVLWGHMGGPVAGTADIIGWVSQELTLADWKTSKSFYTEHEVQNVAYRDLCAQREIVPHRSTLKGLCVRIPKTEGDPDAFETKVVDQAEDEKRVEVFTHLRSVQPWVKAEDERSRAEWFARKNRAAA